MLRIAFSCLSMKFNDSWWKGSCAPVCSKLLSSCGTCVAGAWPACSCAREGGEQMLTNKSLIIMRLGYVWTIRILCGCLMYLVQGRTVRGLSEFAHPRLTGI